MLRSIMQADGFGGADSRLILGTAWLDTYEPSTFSALLDAAWDAGIRRIDTAPAYAGGKLYGALVDWERRSGRLFGHILKPGRPLVHAASVSRHGLKDLRDEVLRTMDMLGGVAAVLIKDPPASSIEDGSVGELLEGIDAILDGSLTGLCTNAVASCARLPPADQRIVAIEYHVANRWVSVPVAAQLKASGWCVWAMQPLAFGYLASNSPYELDFKAPDWRLRLPGSVRRFLSVSAQGFLDSVREKGFTQTPATLSIAYCLADANVDAVIIGPKSPSQLQDALAALALSEHPTFASLAADIRRGHRCDLDG